MAEGESDNHIETIRRFNRFYTGQIGVLRERLLKSPFSLTEARVLYEISRHALTTATDIGDKLGLDPGYLSRILGDFQKRGLIGRRQSEIDGRQSLVYLTESGQEAFASLDGGAREDVRAMVGRLADGEATRLVAAMGVIEELLGGSREHSRQYILRQHRPGDIGWVVYRHGILYAREYGWNEEFEALVADVAAKFVQEYDPARERCWIAEMDGENVGSIFLVKQSDTVAKLRLLLVEPKARGLGLGNHLVNECLNFAREAGYRTVTLWTNDVLHAARRIYQNAGFQLVAEEPYRGFGGDQVGQTWELELFPTPS